MLRLTGGLALVASSALAIVLGLHLRSGNCPGRVIESPLAGLSVHMDAGRASGNAWLLDPSGLVLFDGLDGALPAGTEVDIRHCYLVIQRPFFWALDATSIRSGDRTLVYGRSVPAFYGILTLITAAPLLLWAGAALPIVLLSRRGHQTSDAALVP